MSMNMKNIMSSLPTKEDIAEVIARMRDLTSTLPSKEDLLSSAGLRPQKTGSDDVLLGLAMFGAGILVGAAAALLFAPKAGSELRQDISERANEFREHYVGPRSATSPESTFPPTP